VTLQMNVRKLTVSVCIVLALLTSLVLLKTFGAENKKAREVARLTAEDTIDEGRELPALASLDHYAVIWEAKLTPTIAAPPPPVRSPKRPDVKFVGVMGNAALIWEAGVVQLRYVGDEVAGGVLVELTEEQIVVRFEDGQTESFPLSQAPGSTSLPGSKPLRPGRAL